MSTELKGTDSINGNVQLTRYFDGKENGACLQVVLEKIESYENGKFWNRKEVVSE